MNIENFIKEHQVEIVRIFITAAAGTIVEIIFKPFRALFKWVHKNIRKVFAEKKFEQKYKDWLVEKYKFLNVRGIKTNAPVAIELERVFISLRVKKRFGEMTLSEFLSTIKDVEIKKILPERVELSEEEFLKRMEEDKAKRTFELKDLFKLPQKRFIIIGAPGSGKTTLLNYFALKFARRDVIEPFGIEEEYLPVYINLRDTATKEFLDIRKFAENYNSYIECSDNPPQDFFNKKLDDGKCIILLDGLDEVASVKQRIKVAKWVDELATAYSKNIFIATSRPYGYESAHFYNDFLELHILDFTPEQVKDFVEYWTRAVEIKARGDESDFTLNEAKKRADDLLKAIKDNPKIEVLTVNPLLLTIVSLVHRYRAALPKKRVELYEECCDVLLGYWDTAKGIAGELQPRQKRTVLQPLAFYLHQNGLREEKREKFIELLENELPRIGVSKEKAGDFLNNIKERCGVLVETRIDHFGFSHLTFQEFLTARHILDNDLENFLVTRKRDKYWSEVTLLYCGMKDTTAFLQKVLNEKEDLFHTNLFFAGRCLAESLSISPELRDKVTEELYKIYWDKNQFKLSEVTTLEILNKIKDQRIIQKFIDITKDKESKLRWIAAYALVQIKSESAVSPLIELLKDENRNLRVSGADTLGMIKSEAAVSPLIGLLRDEDSDVKVSAAHALGKIKSEAAVSPLIELLKDKDIYVRFAAIDALGKTKSEAAVSPLIELLREEDSNVKLRVAFALKEMKSKVAVSLLIELLKDEDSVVKINAATALGKIKSEAAVSPLIELLRDEDSYVKWCVADALGEIGSQQAVLPLIELLKHEDSDVRRSAADALGKIGSQQAVLPLIELLKDEDSDVRGSAADALGKIESQQAVLPLIELLKDKDSDVRESVADALGKIKSEAAVSPLIELLREKDRNVKWRVADALGEIGSQQAVLPLIELLKDEDSKVRGSATDALGEIGSQQAVLPLIELLKDENSNVRGSAADALGQIGDKKAIESLKLLLNDSDFSVRNSAFNALKEISEINNIPIYRD
jgi:HEAT repeat protein